jgi:peroxiredoxin
VIRRSPAGPGRCSAPRPWAGAVGLLWGIFALAISALGCAAGPARSGVARPTWERPGLRGSVRPEMGSPQPGDPAPDFALPSLTGGVVRLSSLRGSWVVLHFTATWCPYCDAEIVHLGELAADYAARNVKVLTVDLEEDPDVWSAYARQRVAPQLVVLRDRTGTAAARFAPPRAQLAFTDRAQVLFDATLVVDPAGTLRVFLLPDTAHFDPTFAGVRAELDRLMGASGAPVSAPSRTFGGNLLPGDQVVALAAAVRTSQASGAGEELAVRLTIAPGYHVMSDHPSDPFSIPTQVRAYAEGLTFGAPAYPAAGTVGALTVFDGTPEVVLPLRRTSGLPSGPIAVDVRYQACTESRCLAPVRKRLEVSP